MALLVSVNDLTFAHFIKPKGRGEHSAGPFPCGWPRPEQQEGCGPKEFPGAREPAARGLHRVAVVTARHKVFGGGPQIPMDRA